jgi:murein DD-endopeptidase MepM/ murein hydrolase activator NlpD
MQLDQIKSMVIAGLFLGVLAVPALVERLSSPAGTSAQVASSGALSTDLTDPARLPRQPGRHDHLFYRVLEMAGNFETDRGLPGCFSHLSNNFDKQGISFGCLQQNVGSESLQPLLAEMERKYPEVMATVFSPKHHAQILAMLADNKRAQMAWAVGINQHGWKRWRAEFAALGRTPENRRLQLKAAYSVYVKSLALAKKFGLHSERGVVLMFDILTQNGGMLGHLGDASPAILQEFAKLKFNGQDSELERLKVIAEQRAAVAKPDYQKDVLSRKLSIAQGVGVVHRSTYNLEKDFGITMADAIDLKSMRPLQNENQHPSASGMLNPTDGGKITSHYGIRVHPVSGKQQRHTGLDIGVPEGTTVKAADAGTVVFAGAKGGYGNYVQIQHSNGIVTAYGHLSCIDVSVGQKLGRGQAIGRSGQTGHATGPHLHFEVKKHGLFVDPMPYIPGYSG